MSESKLVVEKVVGEGHVDYAFTDHSTYRGMVRLDLLHGDVFFIPGEVGLGWICVDDGDAYREIAEHMQKFSRGVPAQESQEKKPVQRELAPGFEEWAKR